MLNLNEIRIIRDSKYSAPLGLAIDEAILISVGNEIAPNTVRFYYFENPSVVVGINQDVNSINFDFIKKTKMDFGRRLTGGGTIIIGCPNYQAQMGVSFIFKLAPDLPQKLSHKFQFFSKIIIQTLEKLGLQPNYEKNSDITINGKKIVGNGLYISDNSLLFHSMLLFDYDFETMINVLKFDDDSLKNILISKMKDSITTLNKELHKNIPPRSIENIIIECIKSQWNLKIYEGEILEYERKLADKLLKEKYSNEIWNLQTFEEKKIIDACFVPFKSPIDE